MLRLVLLALAAACAVALIAVSAEWITTDTDLFGIAGVGLLAVVVAHFTD